MSNTPDEVTLPALDLLDIDGIREDYRNNPRMSDAQVASLDAVPDLALAEAVDEKLNSDFLWQIVYEARADAFRSFLDEDDE